MNFRKAIFWTHLAAGAAAGGLILFLSATGTLLAFRPQVLSFLQPRLEAPVPGARRLSLDLLAARARDAAPEGAKIDSVSLDSDPRVPLSFGLGREGALYYDPFTGMFLGPGPASAKKFFEAVEGLHRWFGMGGKDREAAKQVKGVCTFLLLFMVVSGLYLWWPNQWSRKVFNAIGIPRGGLQGKAKHWNWHNAAGFWSAPWLLLICLTGIVMLYPWANDLLYRVTGNEPPPRSAPPGPKPGAGGPRGEGRDPGPKAPGEKSGRDRREGKTAFAGWDACLAAVDRRAPDWKAVSIRFFAKSGNNMLAMIGEKDRNAYTRSNLTLDAATAREVKWEPYGDLNAGRKARQWMKPLHTGEAGGVLGALIAALASCGAMVSVYTGLALAWRRFRGKGA